MDQPNMQLNSTGIKCDNPLCDFNDTSVQFEDYKDWLNKPCPNCGCNLLTQEDFDNVSALLHVADIVNSMTQEEIDAIVNNMTPEQKEAAANFVGLPADIEDYTGEVRGKIDTHGSIKITLDPPPAKNEQG